MEQWNKVIQCEVCRQNMTNIGTVEVSLVFCRMLYCKSCKEYATLNKNTNHLEILAELEVEDYREGLIICKLCWSLRNDKIRAKKRKQIEDNSPDFYKRHIIPRGISNRLYCTNHPDKMKGRYTFRHHTGITKDLTSCLKEWGIYSMVRYKKDIPKIIEFFLSIDVPCIHIAKILNIYRPTLDKKIKGNKALENIKSRKKIFNIKVTIDKTADTKMGKIIIFIDNSDYEEIKEIAEKYS